MTAASFADGRRRTAPPPLRTAYQWVLHVIGELLVTAGVVVLLFVGWQLVWTDLVANRTQHAVVEELVYVLAQGELPPGAQTEVPIAPEDSLRTLRNIAPGDAWGIIRIPRFGDEWERPLVEGVDLRYLNHGVGRYPQTQLPGEVGNFALAGHRTTWGRPFYDIETLQPGDEIIIETYAARYVYRYERSRIVRPDQSEILAPTPDQPGVAPTRAMLTITACHPKFSAQQRWIAYAVLERTEPRTPSGTSGTAPASGTGLGGTS